MTKNSIREGADSADRSSSRTASPASGESFADQIARVGLMSEGDPQWDLSDNDCEALHAVLCAHDELLAALTAIKSQCAGHSDEFARRVWVVAHDAIRAAKAEGR